MADTQTLVATLKAVLKTQGFTYSDVAKHLNLSEASIKHMFSTNNFTLKRLDAICELLRIDLHHLVQEMEDTRTRIDRLTEKQEKELAADTRLLLVAVCVRNNWTFEDITQKYCIEENECVQLLVRLDRLKLIELLPGNRIRLMIAHDFSWIKGGPIERFFETHIQQEFLASNFKKYGEHRQFISAMLSRSSIDTLIRKLKLISSEVAELQKNDAPLPTDEKSNVGILIAMRAWELSVFKNLKRQQEQP